MFSEDLIFSDYICLVLSGFVYSYFLRLPASFGWEGGYGMGMDRIPGWLMAAGAHTLDSLLHSHIREYILILEYYLRSMKFAWMYLCELEK